MVDPWKGYYDSSAQLNETLQRVPANQLARMQLAKGQQEMDDDAAVRNAMQQSGGDLSRAIPAVAQTGNVKAAMGLQKMQDEQVKSKMDVEINRYKIATASAERIANAPRELAARIAEEEIIKNSQMFGQDPTPHLQYLYQTHAKGGPDAIIMDARKASMSIKEQMDLQDKQQMRNRQDEQFSWQRQHGIDTLSETKRGHDITRDKENQAKIPSGYKLNVDGTMGYIPNGPADPENPLNKKKTDPPGKILPAKQVEDLADMKRVRDEMVIVSDFLAQKTKDGNPVSTGPLAGRLQSAGKLIGAASDDFVNLEQKLGSIDNIMLRLRSGAAVTEQEYERFKKEYPTANDREEVRDRKLKNAMAYASNLLDEKISLYDESGYKVPKSVKDSGRSRSLDDIFKVK